MKEIAVKGTVRTAFGKKAAKEIRKTDAVPCVLYGAEKDAEGKQVATHFTATNAELRNLIYTPEIYTVNLNIDGKECKAVMREIQFHPVKDNVLHVDFYQITPEKPIVMEVPVKLNGLAEGVKAGGKLVLSVRKLKVKATYDKIPEKLNIDVTPLELGKTIKVGELAFDGLEIMNAKEVVVCGVKVTRAAQSRAAQQ
ncbi:MAG: 50S ribosomal protein L25/general stress protein Ctc [Bacteroidaceae bacterium]|nr:50S ribosomal protein L25/general stress protein Ctc [Bacteroidaceae bacterium]